MLRWPSEKNGKKGFVCGGGAQRPVNGWRQRRDRDRKCAIGQSPPVNGFIGFDWVAPPPLVVAHVTRSVTHCPLASCSLSEQYRCCSSRKERKTERKGKPMLIPFHGPGAIRINFFPLLSIVLCALSWSDFLVARGVVGISEMNEQKSAPTAGAVMGYKTPALAAASGSQPAKDGPVTGGGLSQNGKFSYGYASSPGKRSSMEDFYETRIDGVEGEIVGLFGVFDGHGGVQAAEYVKENLFSNLISHPKFISDTKSAISDAYNHTDSEFLKTDRNQPRDAGSTASTAILVGDRLLVANVGDSRAVICRGGQAIAVSRDHKPDQTDERQRIEDAGGFVMWAGTWRVGGVLAVSRAFGDKLLKQYVVADPEIKEEKVDSSLEFLILASDGLWDVVSNDEAVSMVKPIEDPEEAARMLLQEAYQRGSADNITCVVVRFRTELEHQSK